MFLLTTNLNMSNYPYLEPPPPPFIKGGLIFSKIVIMGGGGGWEIFTQNGGRVRNRGGIGFIMGKVSLHS